MPLILGFGCSIGRNRLRETSFNPHIRPLGFDSHKEQAEWFSFIVIGQFITARCSITVPYFTA